MDKQLIERLEKLLSKHDVLVGKPATEEQILEVERKLGVTFHSDYRNFIKRFGGAYAGLEIRAFENGSALGQETVIDLTMQFRKDLSFLEDIGNKSDYYAFSLDGSGDYIFSGSDGVVYTYYHDTGELRRLADSLEQLIKQTIPDVDNHT